MKVLVILLLAVVAISNAKFTVHSNDALENLSFADKIAYNVWNGFVRGFYKEQI